MYSVEYCGHPVDVLWTLMIAKGQIRYLIKWKGYEKVSDRTWETEENLWEGARELLEEYWTKLGGKPTAVGKKSHKKRGRQSTGGTPDSTAKKQKQAQVTKVEGRRKRQATPDLLANANDDDEDGDWKPPKGQWEDLIQTVETIEKDNAGKLWAFVLWNEKGRNGRFRRSRHPLDEGGNSVYARCPRKMLEFYQSHLVFTDGTNKLRNDPTTLNGN